MRKKTMMVAMLLSALMLGACVDNNESASVEAVRTAKAEQLKSVAAMNNAEAEATKLLAEADVALKNAEAEAKKIQNDNDKANLAVKMAGQEAALKQAIAEAENSMLTAQEALKTALQNADDATRTRITTLASNYGTAVSALNALKITVAGEQNTLIGLQYDLITAQEALAKNIAGYKETISENEAEIATYKEYGTSVGMDGLKAALATSKAAQVSLENAEDIATGKKAVLTSSAATALTAYNNCDYNTLAKKSDYSNHITLSVATSPYVYAKVVNVVTFEMAVVAKEADAKTALDAVVAPKAAYDKAVTDLATAEKAWRDAEDADKATKKTAYDNALSDLNTKEATYNAAQNASAATAKTAATWRTDFTYLTQTGLGAQKEMVDALNAANKAVVDAGDALTKASADLAAEQAKGTALTNLLSGLTDINAAIATCEAAIATAKANLAKAESSTGSPAAKEELIAQAQANIEVLNNKIKAGEANVKSAKAALDAAMAE